jgi:hypothetical protein
LAKKRKVYRPSKTAKKTSKSAIKKKTEEHKKLYTESWDIIRHRVYKRDGGCVCCGRTKIRLSCHHLSPVRVSHDNNMNNLISVCSSCHKKLDNIAFAVLRSGGHQSDAVRIQLKIIAEERQKRIDKMKKIEEDKKNGGKDDKI